MPDDNPNPVQTTPSLLGAPTPTPAEEPQTGAEPSQDALRAALGGDAPAPEKAVTAAPAQAPPTDTKAVATKPHMGMDQFLPVTTVGRFGGSETFADYDQWKKAAEIQNEVDTLTAIFDGLLMNIRNDPELKAEVKAQRIAMVAGELGTRIEAENSSHLDEDDKALDEPSKTFWFEAEDFTFTFQQDQTAAAEKAATKRDRGVELKASDFADVPDVTKPSTWKLPLVTQRSGNFDLNRIGDAITALQPGGFRGNRVQLGSPKARVKSRIRSAIRRATGPAERKTTLIERLGKVKEMGDGGSFVVFKDLEGRDRWVTFHSNEYVDREGERFDSKAHDEFVQWVDQDKAHRMPELRTWHMPGSRLGVADMVDHTSEGFMIASGTFDPGMEGAAKALSEMDDVGCSHGFWFDRDAFEGGVYHRYRSFEISVLPRDRAANEATGFIAGKEVPMMDPDKKAYLVSVGGDAYANAVETGLSELSKAAEAKGLSYKDYEASVLSALTGPTQKAEGDPDPGTAPPPEAAAGSLEALIAPLASGMAAVAETVKTIGDKVTAQGEQIAALKEGDDAKIADAFRPKYDPTKGFVASEQGEEPAEKDKKDLEAGTGVPDYLKGYVGEDGSIKGLNGAPLAIPAAPA